MYRSCIFGLLAGSIGLMSGAQATEPRTCRPGLAFKEVRFSAMQPPTWSENGARCCRSMRRAARRRPDASNRLLPAEGKRPEIEFQEQFTWEPALVEVSVDFWADEAVEGYWLHNVAPCPCRD